MQPIYTASNTTSAYQLNWSLSLFGKTALPPLTDCLDQLKTDTERDGVRILEARIKPPNVGQFLVSTRPGLTPWEIARSVKGRWQYAIRSQDAGAFRRNYHIESVGEVTCSVLDKYVAVQPERHSMVDPRVQERLLSLQFYDPEIDLRSARMSAHASFIYDLQVVVENAECLQNVEASVLSSSREMIIRAALKKQWLLSRIGIVSNHIHILLGARLTDSPASIALALMNNLAYAQGMNCVLRFSYYVGTFGPYDRNAVRQLL